MLNPEQRSPRNFYGPNCSRVAKKLENKASEIRTQPPIAPYVLTNLLNGPSICWKVFKKQEDALNWSKTVKFGTMTFAFEPKDSSRRARLFLSAHPQVFWHYDVQRPSFERCTYEIITEFAVCKLYVDLEFDKTLNPEKNGNEMIDVFVDVLTAAFKRFLNVDCSIKDIVNLDSSTQIKFSRHLIVDSSFCFVDNINVGRFVKEICRQISDIVFTTDQHIFGVSVDNLRKLFVRDSKGDDKLFVDLSVYTRNRHFRLYGSTKKGKNSNLSAIDKCNSSTTNDDLSTFLRSLVTYVSGDNRVVEFDNPVVASSIKAPRLSFDSSKLTPSPHPQVDKFVERLVSPGKIHKSVYFSSSNLLTYSIIGNRFCRNVNRQHKSNNVKYIVDLNKCEYYQKCYDVDCSNYRSPPSSLPPEIAFFLSNDDNDFQLSSDSQGGIFDIIDLTDTDDDGSVERTTKGAIQKFPSFGLSDEDFLTVDEF